MSDPFADYGKRATTTAVPRLMGIIKTRAEARQRYGEIVKELTAATTCGAVNACLMTNAAELAQFAAELEFLWIGDGMFLGLEKEIAWATARVDAGLDLPRWELAKQEEGQVQ